MIVVQQMITIATFDVIPTEYLEDEVYYFPDLDPYSVNFEMAGIESTFLLSNIGFILWMIIINILFILIHAVLKSFN